MDETGTNNSAGKTRVLLIEEVEQEKRGNWDVKLDPILVITVIFNALTSMGLLKVSSFYLSIHL